MNEEAVEDVVQEVREDNAEKQDMHERIKERLGPEYDEPEQADDWEDDAPAPAAEDVENVDPTPQIEPESMTQVQAAYQHLQQDAGQLQQAVQKINWNQLRQENPAQYANLVQEVQQRQAQIAQREQQIRGAAEGVQSKYLEGERAKVLKAIPEWKDPDVAAREKYEVREFLKSKGYTEQEVNGVTARDVVNARKWMVSERKAQTAKPLKRLKPKPKQRPTGLRPDVERMMEQNAKRKPGGSDDIQLRLMRKGIV